MNYQFKYDELVQMLTEVCNFVQSIKKSIAEEKYKEAVMKCDAALKYRDIVLDKPKPRIYESQTNFIYKINKN